MVTEDLLRDLIEGGILTGFVDPANPLLGEFSIDELWTALDGNMVRDEYGVKVSEFLHRLIILRTPLDNKFTMGLGDFFIIGDITVEEASNGAFTIPTGDSFIFTEGAAPDANPNAYLTVPNDYVVEIHRAIIALTEQDLGVSVNAAVGDGVNVWILISGTLDGSTKPMREYLAGDAVAKGVQYPPVAGPGDIISLYSTAQMDANSVMKFVGKILATRMPSWVKRL